MRQRSAITLLLCVGAVTAVAACRASEVPPPAPPGRVRLTTGTPGGGFQPLGDALAVKLRGGDLNLDVEVRQSAGSISNVDAIQLGDADVGFAFADVAYTAFAGGLTGRPEPFSKLRGIAVLQLTPLHLVTAPRADVSSLSRLRGRRVAVGLPGSGSAVTASLVMTAVGIAPPNVSLQSLAYNAAAAKLTAGGLDALFVVGSVPLESVALAAHGGARLMPLAGPEIDRLRHRYPFLRRATIAGGSYSNHPSPIATIGVDNLLVCSSALDEGLVYALTKRLFEVLPSLARSQPSLRLMDLEQAPATPIPLHDGAARYYREREIAR